MTAYSDRSTYSKGAIAFHWTIAALIVVNMIIGLFHDGFGEAKGFWMAQHKAIGLTVLILSVGRLGWRFTHRPPPPLASHAKWERMLAKVTHTLLYALMIGIPLTGWLMTSAGSGKPVNMFGLFSIPPLVGPDKEAAGIYSDRHEMLAFVMIGLWALHVAGALKHHFLDRDTTLSRMIPFLRRS